MINDNVSWLLDCFVLKQLGGNLPFNENVSKLVLNNKKHKSYLFGYRACNEFVSDLKKIG